MNYISPTRVSIYDFLTEDTLPLTVLLADIAKLSLPQAQLAQSASIQAIVSALLAYQARHGGTAVIKKLFSRNGIKELRQYNSMNFVTIDAAFYHRQAVTEALFADSRSMSKVAEHIASHIDAPLSRVYILLTTLCVICLRELAILTDYAQLDGDDVDNWLNLQPQFLHCSRFDAASQKSSDSSKSESLESAVEMAEQSTIGSPLTSTNTGFQPPKFDPFWHRLLGYSPPANLPIPASEDEVPHYAKLIGRSSENASQSLHDELLVFAPMTSISLPHQRWLLQLAKISDIYLSRHRLRIASEPMTPPSRPLVNLGLLSNPAPAPTTAHNSATSKDIPSTPLWRNPVILLIILVIGGLSILALLKYQSQQGQKVAVAAAQESDPSTDLSQGAANDIALPTDTPQAADVH